MSVSTNPHTAMNLSVVAWAALALVVGIVIATSSVAIFTTRDQPLIVCDKSVCRFQEAAR